MSYLEAQAAGGFLLAPVAHFQTNLILRELDGPAIAAITTAMNTERKDMRTPPAGNHPHSFGISPIKVF